VGIGLNLKVNRRTTFIHRVKVADERRTPLVRIPAGMEPGRALGQFYRRAIWPGRLEDHQA
jgi:hypothetical protein